MAGGSRERLNRREQRRWGEGRISYSRRDTDGTGPCTASMLLTMPDPETRYGPTRVGVRTRVGSARQRQRAPRYRPAAIEEPNNVLAQGFQTLGGMIATLAGLLQLHHQPIRLVQQSDDAVITTWAEPEIARLAGGAISILYQLQVQLVDRLDQLRPTLAG